MQARLILKKEIFRNVFPPQKNDREVPLAFSKGKVVMDSAIREGAGAPRVINAPFPAYPMVPGSQPPPGSQFFIH